MTIDERLRAAGDDYRTQRLDPVDVRVDAGSLAARPRRAPAVVAAVAGVVTVIVISSITLQHHDRPEGGAAEPAPGKAAHRSASTALQHSGSISDLRRQDWVLATRSVNGGPAQHVSSFQSFRLDVDQRVDEIYTDPICTWYKRAALSGETATTIDVQIIDEHRTCGPLTPTVGAGYLTGGRWNWSVVGDHLVLEQPGATLTYDHGDLAGSPPVGTRWQAYVVTANGAGQGDPIDPSQVLTVGDDDTFVMSECTETITGRLSFTDSAVMVSGSTARSHAVCAPTFDKLNESVHVLLGNGRHTWLLRGGLLIMPFPNSSGRFVFKQLT